MNPRFHKMNGKSNATSLSWTTSPSIWSKPLRICLHLAVILPLIFLTGCATAVRDSSGFHVETINNLPQETPKGWIEMHFSDDSYGRISLAVVEVGRNATGSWWLMDRRVIRTWGDSV